MKQGIHPDYIETKVTCGCGASWLTRSTKAEINVEICSSCHPFYTGRAKFVDTAGRIERFQRKYAWTEEAAQAATQKKGQGGGAKTEAGEAGGE